MARLRTLKPSFFSNELLAEIDPLGRLLFQGLWCQADRDGRLEDRPKRLKVEILPFDECDLKALLDELDRRGFIVRYGAAGRRLIQIVNFAMHQKPHRLEQPSLLPPPMADAWTIARLRDVRTTRDARRGESLEARYRRWRRAVLERDGRRCRRCCKARQAGRRDLHAHHIEPWASCPERRFDVSNGETLCEDCHTAVHEAPR